MERMKWLVVLVSPAAALVCAASVSAPDAYSKNRQLATISPVSLSGGQQDSAAAVTDWFKRYDKIRTDATMTPAERSQSHKLLGKGLNPIASEQEKQSARELASRMASRYTTAINEMRRLHAPHAVQSLHNGFLRYFTEAHQLFSEYLSMQDNIFSTKKANFQALAGRKHALEELDEENKELDKSLRKRYSVAPLS